MLYRSAGVWSAGRGCAIEAQISYPVCVLAYTYAESSGHLKSDAKVRRCSSVEGGGVVQLYCFGGCGWGGTSWSNAATQWMFLTKMFEF